MFFELKLNEKQIARVAAHLKKAEMDYRNGLQGAVICQIAQTEAGNVIATGCFVECEEAQKIKAVLKKYIKKIKGLEVKK